MTDFISYLPIALLLGRGHARLLVLRELDDLTLRSGAQCLIKRVVDRDSDTVIWQTETGVLYSLIEVGDLIIVGGDEVALALSASDGKELWRQEVDGRATGLAAAEGRLFVSTDVGHIYTYGRQ